MHENSWCIVCPGPSMNLYETKKRISQGNFDVLVAVNGAILLDSSFNYWAVIDPEVFDSIFKITKGAGIGTPTLWISSNWNEAIIHAFPHLTKFFNSFQKETFPANSLEFGQTLPFGRHINWKEVTLFAAIALAIKKEAKTIKIFGADMSGEGYCAPGLINSRTRHTERRWAEERHWLEEIINICDQNGITVIREAEPCLK